MIFALSKDSDFHCVFRDKNSHFCAIYLTCPLVFITYNHIKDRVIYPRISSGKLNFINELFSNPNNRDKYINLNDSLFADLPYMFATNLKGSSPQKRKK